MSDVLVWIPVVFPDTRPLRPTQVSAVINLHRSKLPCIPNEGRKREGGGIRRGRKKKAEDKEGGKGGEVTLWREVEKTGRKLRRGRQEKEGEDR